MFNIFEFQYPPGTFEFVAKQLIILKNVKVYKIKVY
jgi:hypothetical protein